MKRLILIMIIGAMGFTHQAKAQWAVIDPTNLVQNIFQVMESSTTASNMIKNVQESVRIYQQGKEYYDKLKSVHNVIKDARKVQETVAMLSEISGIYANNFNKMLSDKNFTVEELAAISDGYAKLLAESGHLLTEVKEVVSTSNGLSMTDAERMAIVDRIYTDMKGCRSLVQYFTNKTIAVSYLRSKTQNDTDRILALYGSPGDRYW